ncbi:type II secretion system protein [bacterium]|nr:type II secretion system protein [bacterium]
MATNPTIHRPPNRSMRRNGQAGVTLVEVLVAIGLATTVTLIVAQILVNTIKVQKRSDLRNDLQAFVTRINNDVDCGKTFASISSPTDANCQYLTLKSSSGEAILTPDASAQGVFTGSGPITKNWWGMARCDETQRSIVIYVAMKDPGSWAYGKDPVKANNDDTDVLQLQHWTAAPSPLFGGTGKPKLCESYFAGSTAVRDCSQSPYTQYVTGLASGDSVTCAPMPTPNVADNCATGKVAYGFDMQTNKPKCRNLTTTDLSAISGIQTWLRQQVIPSCTASQVYVADSSSPNTMKCASTYKARRCYNSSTKDYQPSMSDSCGGAPGVGWSWDGGYFDFSVLPATIP